MLVGASLALKSCIVLRTYLLKYKGQVFGQVYYIYTVLYLANLAVNKVRVYEPFQREDSFFAKR